MDSELSQGAESKVKTKPGRLYYLDWLRVLAMASIFFFHNNRFFDFDGWHVKNAETSLGSTIFTQFFSQWMMPLFFLIAGAAVYYALRFRAARQFIRERSLRLMIPLVTVGMFVLAPPQVYLERLSQGEFSGTFPQFYHRYFDGLYGFGGNFAFHGMHLWFLLFLFIFSVTTLPLLLPRKGTGKSLISRLATLFEKPWALMLLLLPLAATSILADVTWLGWTRQMGGWDTLSYLLFFIYGYLVFSNTQIQENIKRYSTIALIVALVLTTVGFVLRYQVNPQILFGTPEYVGIMLLRASLAWCWLIAILGFGSRVLNRNNRFLGYANEAVLPFYVLHQTVILIIGFYVVQWNMGIPAKYAIISATSFATIMAIYVLLIRRINPLRFVFGMRPKKPKVD